MSRCPPCQTPPATLPTLTTDRLSQTRWSAQVRTRFHFVILTDPVFPFDPRSGCWGQGCVSGGQWGPPGHQGYWCGHRILAHWGGQLRKWVSCVVINERIPTQLFTGGCAQANFYGVYAEFSNYMSWVATQFGLTVWGQLRDQNTR